MTKRAFLHLTCALLLLFAQHGALTHSVWHLRHHFPAPERQNAAVTAQPTPDNGQSSQSRLCDLHFALSALLAGDCGGKTAVQEAAVTNWLAVPAGSWRIAQPTTTPPSRAPPVLL